jgi:hypothetical protein
MNARELYMGKILISAISIITKSIFKKNHLGNKSSVVLVTLKSNILLLLVTLNSNALLLCYFCVTFASVCFSYTH